MSLMSGNDMRFRVPP